MLAVTDWLLLIGVCALGAMTPGASLAVVTRHTLRGSARAGVSAGLAHAAGIGVYAVSTVAGSSSKPGSRTQGMSLSGLSRGCRWWQQG